MVEPRSNSEGHKLDDWKDWQTCYGLIFSTWGGAFVVPDQWRQIFHMVRISQPATAVVKEFGATAIWTFGTRVVLFRGPARYLDIHLSFPPKSNETSQILDSTSWPVSVLQVFNCAKEVCALPGKACVECGKARLYFFSLWNWLSQREGLFSNGFSLRSNEVGLLQRFDGWCFTYIVYIYIDVYTSWYGRGSEAFQTLDVPL